MSDLNECLVDFSENIVVPQGSVTNSGPFRVRFSAEKLPTVGVGLFSLSEKAPTKNRLYLHSADSGRLIATPVVEENCIVVNDGMRMIGHVQSVLITQIQTVWCFQTFQKSLKTFRSVKTRRWAQFSLNQGCSHQCFLFAAVIHLSHKTNRNSSNLSEKMKVLHFVIYKILIFWCRL